MSDQLIDLKYFEAINWLKDIKSWFKEDELKILFNAGKYTYLLLSEYFV